MPAVVYWWVGFWTVSVAESPKSHSQLVTVPVDRSVKSTLKGAVPVESDALKAAAGGPSTVM